MRLVELPPELIDEIWLHLDTPKDMNAFVQTSRYVCKTYNPSLYRRTAQHDCSAAAHWAGQHGHINTIQKLISAGANVISNPKLNPLIPAVENGHEELVRFLLNERDNDPIALPLIFKDNTKSALHIAAEHGHTAIASLLIDAGYPLHGTQVRQRLPRAADEETPFMDEYWETPLIAAAGGGHEETILLLLNAGARTDLLDGGYQSALWCAAHQNCSIPMIELLLSKTADEVLNHADFTATSPLGAATQEGHLEVMKVLIASGRVDFYAGGRENTPLRLTIEYDQPEAARILLDAGVSANGNAGQYPPVPMAAKLGTVEILRMLLDHGADPLYVLPWRETPMGYAAWQGHYEVVEMLLDAGAPADLEDDQTHTPLVSALREGYDDIAVLLAERGARWNPGGDRVTPLQLAIRNGNRRVVEILLFERGARFPYVDESEEEEEGEEEEEEEDDGYRPALMVAAMNMRTNLIRLLLRQGGDPCEEDWRGRTALSVAAERGFFDLVMALLEDGTDMQSWSATYHPLPGEEEGKEICPSGRHIRAGRGRAIDKADRLGRTPLFYATVNGRVEIVAALLARGSTAMDRPTCADRTPRSVVQEWASHPQLASRETVRAMRDMFADVSQVKVPAGPVQPVGEVYDPEKREEEGSEEVQEAPVEGVLYPFSQSRDSLDMWFPHVLPCEHCYAQVNDYGHSFLCRECHKDGFVVCPECFARGKRCRVKAHSLQRVEKHHAKT